MPRPPFPTARAKRLLQEWLAFAVTKSPSEAPITVEVALDYLASRRVSAHRSTLYKYKLNGLLDAARLDQEKRSRRSGAAAEAAAYEATLDELRRKNGEMEGRLRGLLAEIATMTFNARRLGISEQELTMPMPKPDRSQPATGRGGRRRPS